jgi:hypothetical protein
MAVFMLLLRPVSEHCNLKSTVQFRRDSCVSAKGQQTVGVCTLSMSVGEEAHLHTV